MKTSHSQEEVAERMRVLKRKIKPYFNLTNRIIGDNLGKHYNTIQLACTAGKKVTLDIIELSSLADMLGVNKNWLANGEGEFKIVDSKKFKEFAKVNNVKTYPKFENVRDEKDTEVERPSDVNPVITEPYAKLFVHHCLNPKWFDTFRSLPVYMAGKRDVLFQALDNDMFLEGVRYSIKKGDMVLCTPFDGSLLKNDLSSVADRDKMFLFCTDTEDSYFFGIPDGFSDGLTVRGLSPLSKVRHLSLSKIKVIYKVVYIIVN
jgi:hypothetical protein